MRNVSEPFQDKHPIGHEKCTCVWSWSLSLNAMTLVRSVCAWDGFWFQSLLLYIQYFGPRMNVVQCGKNFKNVYYGNKKNHTCHEIKRLTVLPLKKRKLHYLNYSNYHGNVEYIANSLAENVHHLQKYGGKHITLRGTLTTIRIEPINRKTTLSLTSVT